MLEACSCYAQGEIADLPDNHLSDTCRVILEGGLSGGVLMSDCPYFQISKSGLIAVAGGVWCLAGVNVARIGVESFAGSTVGAPWICLLPPLVFAAFGAMFTKVAGKHIRRIRSHPRPARPLWHFFDLRSYLVMAIMMGGGIGLRISGVLPDFFIAFFYTGLGAALAAAGLLFFGAFIRDVRRGQ